LPLRRYFALPRARQLLLAEASVSLALARMALVFIPFRVLAARFGTFVNPKDIFPRHASALSPEQRLLVTEIGWAVTRAARYLPFRAVCLPQAIAAKTMASRRRIPSTVHFGVMRSGDAVAAHAWLDADGIQVTGFPLSPDIVEMAWFR
jgi:hypothetical protein